MALITILRALRWMEMMGAGQAHKLCSRSTELVAGRSSPERVSDREMIFHLVLNRVGYQPVCLADMIVISLTTIITLFGRLSINAWPVLSSSRSRLYVFTFHTPYLFQSSKIPFQHLTSTVVIGTLRVILGLSKVDQTPHSLVKSDTFPPPPPPVIPTYLALVEAHLPR